MMKSWNSLTQQIEVWRQKHKYLSKLLGRKKVTPQDKYAHLNTSLGEGKPRYKRPKSRWQYFFLMLLFAIISLTSIVGYRFYNQPQLTVGKISPVTITAPRAGKFEDTKTTLEKRQEVQTGIVPILKHNEDVTTQIKTELTDYLDKIDQLRKLTQPFPFYDTQILSLTSQQYIRSCDDSEFTLAIASAYDDSNNIAAAPNAPPTRRARKFIDDEIDTTNFPSANSANFDVQLQQVILELRKYRQQTLKSEFNSLISQITLTRYRYAQGWKNFKQKQHNHLAREEIAVLLDLTENKWAITKETIFLAAERILAQGIPQGMPTNLLEKAITIQLSPDIPATAAHLAHNILLKILEPNLEEDKDATRNIAEQAARAIEPVIVESQQGEIIVEEGARITQANFVLLDGFGLSRRRINWQGLQLATMFVTVIVGLFLLIQRRIYTSVRRRDYLLLCLLSLSTPLLGFLNIQYTNLPAIGLLVSSFYNPGLAVCHVTLLTALLMFSSNLLNWQYLLAGTTGGLLAAIFAGRLRSREAMARLGVIVGLTQGSVYFISNLILSASAITIWAAILPGAIIYGLSGVAWSIVAIGISPYLERFFDLITPIRLAELSNPNLPLLKRLATEAPGTFQHTMFVASLAEAAARELNCNVELVRAGTLYHDIGKMHDALGFIENQMGGPNKHDEIDDPIESVEIIKKHVSEGLVMARKYGLPKAIRDFIPEHQGTLLIAYFYYQAKQKAEAEGKEVQEADFRYAGPIPQSREAGILMLADGCEAALRSLKEATPKQALATIEKIFKARWRDGQLLDSGLSYDELPTIAEVFVRVWQQFNHKRIAYPKGVLDSNSSEN